MSLEIAPGQKGTVFAAAPGLHVPANSRFLDGSPPATHAAVFLDRDGVLVRDVHYLRTPSQVEILPNAATALRSLEDRFYLIVATNQSGLARGFLSEEDLLAIHAEIVLRLRASGTRVDAFYYCPHLPDALVDAYRLACTCRKPAPGMFLRAAAEWNIDLAGSVVVGDTPRDIEAGRAAGLPQGILLDGETSLEEAALTIRGGSR